MMTDKERRNHTRPVGLVNVAKSTIRDKDRHNLIEELISPVELTQKVERDDNIYGFTNRELVAVNYLILDAALKYESSVTIYPDEEHGINFSYDVLNILTDKGYGVTAVYSENGDSIEKIIVNWE